MNSQISKKRHTIQSERILDGVAQSPESCPEAPNRKNIEEGSGMSIEHLRAMFIWCVVRGDINLSYKISSILSDSHLAVAVSTANISGRWNDAQQSKTMSVASVVDGWLLDADSKTAAAAQDVDDTTQDEYPVAEG